MNAIESQPDPVDICLDRALPGIRDRFSSLNSTLVFSAKSIRSDIQNLSQQNADYTKKVNYMHRVLANMSSAFASASAESHDTEETKEKAPVVSQETRPSVVPTISPTFSSITQMYNEWFGLGEYSAPPHFPGGIDGLEAKKKNSWRAHWNGAQQKHFSRVKFIVRCVQKNIDATGGQPGIEATLKRFDAWFVHCKSSISSLHSLLKTKPNVINEQLITN